MASRSIVLDAYRNLRRAAGQARRTLPDLFRMIPRVAAVSLQKLSGRSDYTRWTDAENLEKWWDSRTQIVGSLVPPGSRVIEFGAGRCQLRHYLPPGCTYFASDLAPRETDTIVCDLNRRPLPDLRHLDTHVAVFGGVLEYMRDLPSLVDWLSGQAPMVVASYDHVKSRPVTMARVIELMRRRNFGYMSSCTVDQLTALFAEHGYRVVRRTDWQNQTITVFDRSAADAADPAVVTPGPR